MFFALLTMASLILTGVAFVLEPDMHLHLALSTVTNMAAWAVVHGGFFLFLSGRQGVTRAVSYLFVQFLTDIVYLCAAPRGVLAALFSSKSSTAGESASSLVYGQLNYNHDQAELLPKVCILTETFYPEIGGGETQARSLAEGLRQQGWQVLILTRRIDTRLPRHEVIGGVPVNRIGPSGAAHWKKWGLLLSSGPALWRLRRQYDLILVSGFRVVGMSAVMASRLLRKPCLLKADNNGEMSGTFFEAGMAKVGLSSNSPLFRLFISIRNTILKKSTGFVAISTQILNELTSHGVAVPKIAFVPNSVDTSIFRPVTNQTKESLRTELTLPLEDTIVIYTGRLVSYKGLPLLVRVWQCLRRKHRGIRLLLVGSGSLDIHNFEEELHDFVTAHALQDAILFTGAVSNVHQYLQASDIFVFPTEKEAFGISLIEAMACGLPVVSTPVGGVKDILEHQQNGLVVQPGDFQQLFEALDVLITDSSLSARLGQAAWQTVQDRYSAQTVIKEYVELFERISSGTGCPRAM
jgi:glycosyltransferase involved in cell wall biosynthesis